MLYDIYNTKKNIYEVFLCLYNHIKQLSVGGEVVWNMYQGKSPLKPFFPLGSHGKNIGGGRVSREGSKSVDSHLQQVNEKFRKIQHSVFGKM